MALVIRQSKTDQEAQGELVTRDCTCSESPNDRCPAHVIWDQVTDRLITGKRLGADMSQAPLFVGPTGDRLSKTEVVEAVKAVALAAGEPLQCKGLNRYGTHSMRVAGALLAFSANVGEETVRALGRWKTTQAMMAYLRGTPVIKAANATAPMAQIMDGGERLGSENFRPIIRDGLGHKEQTVVMPEAGQMQSGTALQESSIDLARWKGRPRAGQPGVAGNGPSVAPRGHFAPRQKRKYVVDASRQRRTWTSRCSTRRDEVRLS